MPQVQTVPKSPSTSATWLLESYIKKAFKAKASDIHIEPTKDFLRIRFRIDGVLREMGKERIEVLSPLASRIKVLARLDITETRKPQDGRFQFTLDNHDLDIRVSIFPTVYGENISLRILEPASILVGLEELGMQPLFLAKYKELISRPNGLILVTGPNGSGKTTTLYSSLNIINSPDKNIVTLEDPVEYHLPYIRQTQVNTEIGLTFASGLRSLLRQDPDIIMVGEIRDKETAEIAVQASLTGHLVLTTLHTNNSLGALIRLINMGIESYLLSSALLCVIAQRLVRKICPECAESYQPPPELLKELGFERKIEFKKGKGCQHCNFTGYAGRTGIFEILINDEEIEPLITSKDFKTIERKAREKGMKSLREAGFEKVIQGITTLEEVQRVTKAD
jgi:type IV pilus assembly protein PilB